MQDANTGKTVSCNRPYSHKLLTINNYVNCPSNLHLPVRFIYFTRRFLRKSLCEYSLYSVHPDQHAVKILYVVECYMYAPSSCLCIVHILLHGVAICAVNYQHGTVKDYNDPACGGCRNGDYICCCFEACGRYSPAECYCKYRVDHRLR